LNWFDRDEDGVVIIEPEGASGSGVPLIRPENFDGVNIRSAGNEMQSGQVSLN